jgi:hypothetical protein
MIGDAAQIQQEIRMRLSPFISRMVLGASALALAINFSPPAVAQAWKVDPSTINSIQTKVNDLATSPSKSAPSTSAATIWTSSPHANTTTYANTGTNARPGSIACRQWLCRHQCQQHGTTDISHAGGSTLGVR